jgi:hypothetical protein
MAAISYDHYDSTSTCPSSNGTTATTCTIQVTAGTTIYGSNMPDAYFERVPDEEGLLQALKRQRRQWSIEALLDLKYQHDRAASPASRCDVDLRYARRPQAQRRTATAVRNWRRR